jgi:hypothetical protein
MVVKVSKPELNLREKISELDKPSGVAGEAMLRAETIAEQQALIGVGNRNNIVQITFQIHHFSIDGHFVFPFKFSPHLTKCCFITRCWMNIIHNINFNIVKI